MAQRVEISSVTCPANTTQANALEVNISFNPGIVREVEIVIPAGHAGVTGLALAQAHQIIIPSSGNIWIIGDDDVLRWPLDGYMNTGSWSAFVYNTDFANAHTWYFRWLIDEILLTTQSMLPVPLSASQIMAAGGA